MAYQLTRNDEEKADSIASNEEADWYIKSWGEYETTSADGGFLDSYNSLKQQIDFVASEYRQQKKSMVMRKQELDEDVRKSVITTALIAFSPAIYNLFLMILAFIGGHSGLISVFFVFLYIFELPVFFVAEALLLPGAIRTLMNRLWQKKYLNSGKENIAYRRKNNIISFDDERRFLDEKLENYQMFCREAEENQYGKADGYFSKLDTSEMIPKQKEILDRMRILSKYEDYRASVVETRKEVGAGWLIIGFSLFVGILTVLLVLKIT